MSKKKVALISYNWANHFSLALGYLKAYALKDAFIRDNAEIEIVDFDCEMLNVQQVVYYLTQTRPDILGFSCYCWNIEKVLDTARIMKTIHPQIKVVFGGPEVGPVGAKYLKENLFIDAVIKGEGEITFAELLKSFLGRGGLESVNGISYREGEGVHENPDRPPIEDLSEIPSPYLEGILTPRDKVTYIETYRGCMFRCHYCFEGKNLPKLRFFPEDRVMKEIEMVLDQPDIRSFHFVDTVFNCKKDRLERISKMIAHANRHGAELRTVEIIAEFMDEETVALFKKASVKSVETGPQTVNEDTLKNVNRFYKADKFKNGVRLLEDNGIEVTSDLIIGLPGDNFLKFIKSAKTIMDMRPSNLVFSILHVLPGTMLYEKSREFGLKFDEKAPHLVLEAPDFPFEDIDKAVILAYSLDREYNIKSPSAPIPPQF
ncbi:MAG TPA: radical SAM protein [Thermodesulfovibrionales bacterium]|nr:radical SAM protein [Thermodesulfovibrionales bacterium]